MSESNDNFQIVLCTAGSGEQAETIARALVERRLAACVNVIGGVCSFFRWQGQIEREDEKLLLIKSAERLFPELQAAIKEMHSYEVPEILAIPIQDGSESYLSWLAESLKP